MMNVDAVLEIVGTLEDAGLRVWLDGGWGVDALLGEQTRQHADLDLIMDVADVAKLKAVLEHIGYRPKSEGTRSGFVLMSEVGGEVDVHPVEFDERGRGVFELGDGRRWPFPPAAFAGRGRIRDRDVPCLSPDAQVQCHGQGYLPTENDLRDMELLQERFGLVLPVGLCRN